MSFVTEQLTESVRLHLLESDRFKTNDLSVCFSMPLKPGQGALLSLLPNVLKCGTERYPDLAALNRRFDLLYASYVDPFRSRKGNVEIFGFGSVMLRDEFVPDGSLSDGVTELFSQLLFHPLTENGVFCSDTVENEKRVQIDSIRAEINNKVSYAIQRCARIMYGDDLAGLPLLGTEEEVAQITPKQLFEFYQTVLSQAQIDVFFVGKTDFDRLRTQLRTLFADMTGVRATVLPPEVIRRCEHPVQVVNEPMPVAQSKLSLGFRTGHILRDDDYAAFTLMLYLLSFSPVSRLFTEVREKLSLCYYCRAIPNGHNGTLILSSGIKAENREKTKHEILRQIDEVAQGRFSAQELEAARRCYLNSLREIEDDPASMQGWYLNRMIAGNLRSPAQMIDIVREIPASRVARMAADLSLDTEYFLQGCAEDTASETEEAEEDE